MTRKEARRVLDRARMGRQVPRSQIDQALIATGDISGEPSTVSPATVDECDLDDLPVRQQVLSPDEWRRKPAGLAPAQWHEVIA